MLPGQRRRLDAAAKASRERAARAREAAAEAEAAAAYAEAPEAARAGVFIPCVELDLTGGGGWRSRPTLYAG